MTELPLKWGRRCSSWCCWPRKGERSWHPSPWKSRRSRRTTKRRCRRGRGWPSVTCGKPSSRSSCCFNPQRNPIAKLGRNTCQKTLTCLILNILLVSFYCAGTRLISFRNYKHNINLEAVGPQNQHFHAIPCHLSAFKLLLGLLIFYKGDVVLITRLGQLFQKVHYIEK